MLQAILLSIFWIVSALVFFTTLAPLSGSNEWWIRGWDFPRVHIAILAICVVVLGIFLGRSSVYVCMILLIGCSVYQAYRIFPFTPWARQEIALLQDVPQQERITLISANVLMGNSDHDKVISLLKKGPPDVVLLLETDQTWVDALTPELSKYDTVVSRPLDNHYGMVFATNLTVHKVEMVYLSDDETPTVIADLEGPTGRFFFVGLHPRPPVPGQDTDARDAQIKKAAQVADRQVQPVVAMGDFNDVAWSHTSEVFKASGGFRDPRIGRGILPSFDANSWLMRFPIDQLYLTQGIGLISFGRLGRIGSDHFPMKAVITVAPTQ